MIIAYINEPIKLWYIWLSVSLSTAPVHCSCFLKFIAIGVLIGLQSDVPNLSRSLETCVDCDSSTASLPSVTWISRNQDRPPKSIMSYFAISACFTSSRRSLEFEARMRSWTLIAMAANEWLPLSSGSSRSYRHGSDFYRVNFRRCTVRSTASFYNLWNVFSP